MNKLGIIVIMIMAVFTACQTNKGKQTATMQTDVLIIGGGASGTMAGIQAARMGVECLIVEETPWLGGMLTSAGVSAVDGNYRLHSGLWEEFRLNLYDYYGGADSVKTGWVSNVLFEPQVGEQILSRMAAAEQKLSVIRKGNLIDLSRKGERNWLASFSQEGKEDIRVKAKIVIDATELGDVVKMLKLPYDIGMDARAETGEEIAPEVSNDIIQDLTYVAVLKDYGDDSHLMKEAPANYNPADFDYTCAHKFKTDTLGKKLWECDYMMEYGKLPNGYYMINWPIAGNDYYLNILEMDKQERQKALQAAKDYTQGYVYFLQHELGFTNLALADDIYGTEDNLPYIPYHRESRRTKGLVRLTVNDVARPFEQEQALYRTGIAVGDYPVDHHHKAYPDAHLLPALHFYPVPSYNLPLGALIPEQQKDFIVAEKSISVSNIINGTTRLQPVCLLIGQASGALAALAVQEDKTPAEVEVRKVQQQLIDAGAYIMPYSDILPDHKAFIALQRIGATGILKGEGKNIGWENHTHIYPDSLINATELKKELKGWLPDEVLKLDSHYLNIEDCIDLLESFAQFYKLDLCSVNRDELYKELTAILKESGNQNIDKTHKLSRAELALVLDRLVNPMHLRQVNHQGQFIN
ncbi:MAG: FAD-dependent oxidoreductase [Carboxylicivirga sp.]|nr:FAD-dependent oxidoreductase [Carboxylicivirga sp.]